jgi:uncharacterized paraquat-inducible protein A
MEQYAGRQRKDLKVLIKFITVYCASRHNDRQDFALPGELDGMFRHGIKLCPECGALLAHSMEKRRLCPLDPKPTCKNCHIHCYRREYREKIREIMAFSGRKMILRGRLDYLWHYFF